MPGPNCMPSLSLFPLFCLKSGTLALKCRQQMPALLKRLKLEHGAIVVDSTPRRLVVRASAVAGRQPDTDERLRGPPAKVICPASPVTVKIVSYVGPGALPGDRHSP